MITAKFIADMDKHIVALTLKGHSVQAETAHDIVCASASILAYTVAQIVTFMEGQGKLTKKPVIKIKEGDAIITCQVNKDEDYAEALHAYFVARVG
jgi:uncharacterized protein YsxB (DUF464 family)